MIATVEHVVHGATRIRLKRDGRVVGVGTVIGSDAARDVALIQTDQPVSGYRFRFETRRARLGDSVATLGFPLALPLTVTRGSVSGLGRIIPIDGLERRGLVQTDAAVNPGNSGGPLITMAGTVLGLVDLGTSQANGIAFAVNASIVKPLIAAWRAAPQPLSAPACPAPTPTVSAPAPVPTDTAPSTPTAASPVGPSGVLYAVTHDAIIRDAPTSQANGLGDIPAGAMVGVQCRTLGEPVYGTWGRDANWNRVIYNGVEDGSRTSG